ncbi:ROK family transcriptional regulator [uncultured Cellulomonas sp.]|uniref:ROK family transcriptional regulator n=1 Tax=uncultured Cellulomonas sp. TaxID=189682 RepID=UPI002622D2EA|nr:ROK family transcriptional regulator [uncultured Cellulomonas sp.]
MTDDRDARAQPGTTARHVAVPPAGTRPHAARGGLRGAGRAAAAARQRTLREHNLSLVLRKVVDARDPVSRAAIATSTGLTRATVSTLVDRLIAVGMVVELAPVATSRAGRPAVPLAPARGTIAAVGLEVNVDYLGVRALDLAGDVVVERVQDGDFRHSDPTAVLDRLATLAGEVIAGLSADGVQVAGAALALPGLVDRVTGPLRVAPNLGWRDVDVVGLLATHPVLAGMPPLLGNEANLAARAEAWARRHEGPLSFVYVSGEVGIGGAIVLDGEIFPGQHGWSGEIGHTVMGSGGDPDSGDTLEAIAGQDALMSAAGLDPHAPLDALLEAAAAGEPDALRALGRAGAALGTALANVVNIVDVGDVVLGGTYAALADHLDEAVRAQLRRRVLTAPWSEVRVGVARAGRYPAMTGAALAVLRAVVEDPAPWGPMAIEEPEPEAVGAG